jgi:L-ascorbate metabolism protein UlaG (beta-lactamase superfamily)
MSYKITMALIAILGVCLPQAALSSRMQPLKKEGRYYYDEHDTHIHITPNKAFRYLWRKLVASEKLLKKATSYFYSTEKVEKKEEIDPIALFKPIQTVPAASSIDPIITWVGHASFLIQINGFNILTDPIFGPQKMGPITLQKRNMPAGIALKDLPRIDAIVISHNHPDHTDAETLMYLAEKYQPTVYVPEANKALVQSMGFKKVVENKWWEKNEFFKDGRSIAITCLPARHWSIRFSLTGERKALWSSWMITSSQAPYWQSQEETKNPYAIYFAGDTAYGKHFKEIAAEFSSIDVALVPIAPTGPGKNKHKESHVDALEAVDAFIDLNAHCFVPMHYATFFSNKTHIRYPLDRLNAYWQEKQPALEGKKLLVARCGQQYAME